MRRLAAWCSMWRSEVSGLGGLRVEGFWSGSATSMVHLLELLVLTEHVLLELLVLEVVLEDFEHFVELFLSLGGVQEEDDQALLDIALHILRLLVLLYQSLERRRGGDEELDEA